MKDCKELEDYKKEVNSKLAQLAKVLAAASVGDFSRDVRIPKKEDEFTTLFVGIQLMFQTVREKISALEKAYANLEERNAEIERSKARDEAILRGVGEGMIVTGMDNRVQFINKVALDILGYSKTEIVGKYWLEDLPGIEDEEGRPIPQKETAEDIAFRTGRVVTKSYYFLRRDRVRVPVTTTASPVFIRRKRVGTIIVFRDITEEKRIDKAKSEFVSLASHQLRAPLSAIKWNTELLLDKSSGRLSEKQKGYVLEIISANKRMIDLMNALLNVSRIEMGTLAISPEKVDLKEIYKSVLGDLTAEISVKRVDINFKIEKDVPAINMDPDLVRIVLLNLISNAVKYTPDGGMASIHIKREDKDVLIIVRDNGYGIPIYDQSKIFTKLFRADNIRDKVPTGTGLGLYVTKFIVEQAGKGKIWFESQENKGTTFYVTLPLKGMVKKEGAKGLLYS